MWFVLVHDWTSPQKQWRPRGGVVVEESTSFVHCLGIGLVFHGKTGRVTYVDGSYVPWSCSIMLHGKKTHPMACCIYPGLYINGLFHPSSPSPISPLTNTAPVLKNRTGGSLSCWVRPATVRLVRVGDVDPGGLDRVDPAPVRTNGTVWDA